MIKWIALLRQISANNYNKPTNTQHHNKSNSETL